MLALDVLVSTSTSYTLVKTKHHAPTFSTSFIHAHLPSRSHTDHNQSLFTAPSSTCFPVSLAVSVSSSSSHDLSYQSARTQHGSHESRDSPTCQTHKNLCRQLQTLRSSPPPAPNSQQPAGLWAPCHLPPRPQCGSRTQMTTSRRRCPKGPRVCPRECCRTSRCASCPCSGGQQRPRLLS